MKIGIEVKNKEEAEAIATAMRDPQTRAFVLVVGNLLQLKTDRARLCVLNFVKDSLDEAGELEAVPLPPVELS